MINLDDVQSIIRNYLKVEDGPVTEMVAQQVRESMRFSQWESGVRTKLEHLLSKLGKEIDEGGLDRVIFHLRDRRGLVDR